jgi:asparagine synthase (glutamine-hydrolysing)
MCGIAGIVGPEGASLELLAELATALRHRGPDDEGYVTRDRDGSLHRFRGDETIPELVDLPHWKSGSARRYPVGLAHRRLSILDLSRGGHQPMISPDGNVALVFGGEIYNYVELADELEALGWKLRPCGDTAVLLAAFSEWGPGCVHRLRGMWAFAAHDRRSGLLTLSRDRFGIKPFYYTRLSETLAFSSEIKGLLPVLPSAPRGSVQHVAHLLAWGRLDDEEATLFEDVLALPPGCNLYVNTRDLTCRLERYYDVGAASPAADFQGDFDAAVREYRRLLEQSVRLHMRSDVQVGACLSGGLDSNLTAALATEHSQDGRLSTFTAAYDDPALDESKYVQLHSRRSGRLETHFAFPTAESLLTDIDQLVWAQDQPMASSSPFAQWAVMRCAADHNIKVLLDGQGADEAIGGYSYFAGVSLLELLRRGHALSAVREARSLKTNRAISPWQELARAAYRQLPVFLRGPIRRRSHVGPRLIAPAYREAAGGPAETTLRTFQDYSIDAVRHSLPELLRYEDRSSMAFSIESRVPFLDHSLVEFVLSLPSRFKLHHGWSKLVQRKAGEGLLPPEITWRRDKLGFTTPQRQWKERLAAPLQEYVRQADIPSFLDRDQVQRLVSSHVSGSTELSDFWKTILLLKWIEVYRVRFSDS